MKTSQPVAAVLMLGFALSASGGVTLIQSYQEVDGQKPAISNTIRLDKDRARIDAGGSPDAFFIYRGDKKAFYAVNLKEKSYLEMTEKDLEQMVAKMDEARNKMKESLAKMPPDQRKSMEDMMAKMMPGGAETPKTVYRKTGPGGTVNGWNTDRYEGSMNGEKHMEIWTTPPKNMDIAEEDFQVVKDMGKFFQKFSKNMDWLAHANDKDGFQGMPVKTISYKDGKPRFQSEVKAVKKENQAASLFEIPAGLTQKKIGMQ